MKPDHCPDIDGIEVRVVEHAYCAHCGRPAIRTSSGWQHDPLFTGEAA